MRLLDPTLAARDLIENQKVQATIGPQTWAEASLVAEVCTQKSILFLVSFFSRKYPMSS